MVLAPSVAGLFKCRQFEPEMILLAVGSTRSLGRAKRSGGVIARHISFEVVDCRGRKNHFSTSLIETIPTMLVPSRTGRCRTRFSVITRIHSVMLSLGVAVNNSWVMISLTGVSFKERPFSITFRV